MEEIVVKKEFDESLVGKYTYQKEVYHTEKYYGSRTLGGDRI